MGSDGLHDLVSGPEKPPEYKRAGNGHANPEFDTLDIKTSPYHHDLPVTERGSQPPNAEGSSRSRPVIVMFQRRRSDLEHLSVERRLKDGILYAQNDVFLLNSKTTFDDIRDHLLLRSKEVYIYPPEYTGETPLPVKVSVLTNRAKRFPDVVDLDAGNWEAGRELLFTQEDAVLRFRVNLTSKHALGDGNGNGKGKCVVQ